MEHNETLHYSSTLHYQINGGLQNSRIFNKQGDWNKRGGMYIFEKNIYWRIKTKSAKRMQ